MHIRFVCLRKKQYLCKRNRVRIIANEMEMQATNISVAEIVDMLIMILGVVIVLIAILSYRNNRESAPNNVDVNTSKKTEMCLDCCGSGHCSQCRGTGFRTDNMFGLGQDPSKECGICRGTGDCQKCGGVGRK